MKERPKGIKGRERRRRNQKSRTKIDMSPHPVMSRCIAIIQESSPPIILGRGQEPTLTIGLQWNHGHPLSNHQAITFGVHLPNDLPLTRTREKNPSSSLSLLKHTESLHHLPRGLNLADLASPMWSLNGHARRQLHKLGCRRRRNEHSRKAKRRRRKKTMQGRNPVLGLKERGTRRKKSGKQQRLHISRNLLPP
jgi:hypothetical protein